MEIEEELYLSVRAANCLRNSGVRTVEQLVELSRSNLLAIPHLGRRTLMEIEREVERLGFTLSEVGCDFDDRAPGVFFLFRGDVCLGLVRCVSDGEFIIGEYS